MRVGVEVSPSAIYRKIDASSRNATVTRARGLDLLEG